MKVLLPFLVALIIGFISVSPVNAIAPLNFPSCSNPQGTLQVEYISGIHGIPGDLNAYTGSDKVYKLDSERIQQCLCTLAGNGIQTNWWRVGSISQEDINTLVKLNWKYVPDGSVWGLNNEPYMAYNSTYSCSGSVLGASDEDDSQDTAQSTPNPIGSVLGLATTGDISKIYGLIILGINSILFSFLLKYKYSC